MTKTKKISPQIFEDSLRKTYEQAVAEDINMVKVNRIWLLDLGRFAERYEKCPSEENKQLLLGYLSSIKSLLK